MEEGGDVLTPVVPKGLEIRIFARHMAVENAA